MCITHLEHHHDAEIHPDATVLLERRIVVLLFDLGGKRPGAESKMTVQRPMQGRMFVAAVKKQSFKGARTPGARSRELPAMAPTRGPTFHVI